MAVTEERLGTGLAPSSGDWLRGLWLPLLVAVAAVTAALVVVVAASPSAWRLLGAGHGLVPEALYPVSGFALVLGTTLGQAVGWAAGSALLFYVMTRVGFGATLGTARIAMSLVYLGLAVVPLFVYHVFYGGWLLGLPRTGLEEWLVGNHPDAYWLLIQAHDAIDLSVGVLAALFLAVVWGSGSRLVRETLLQTLAALAMLFTSLAVALSLAIHSTLAHIRL